ncbi:MAG: PEP-CTERM sorting domain-containing protein [Methylovulum sp.]|nr:PEP-CTERM sorting domain-containing protein [Methylovulum sp.]
MKKNIALLSIAITFSLGLMSKAWSATILFDNTYNNTYSSSSGSGFSSVTRSNGIALGIGSTAYTLDSVSIALQYSSSQITPNMTMQLWSIGSGANKPADGSSPIYTETFSSVVVPQASAALVTFAPSGTWILDANSRYAITWKSDFAAFSFMWRATNPSVNWVGNGGVSGLGVSNFTLNDGATWSAGGTTNYGIKMIGTEYSSSAVPEPSTNALFFIGLGMMVFYTKKERNRI